jgi:peptidyl-prolyl cis-trans isomerase D
LFPLATKEELDRLVTQFKSSTEDSIFASVNSDGLTPFSRYTIANLPAILNDQRSTLTPGQVIGPVLDGGKYYLYKISRIGKDTVYNAKASHILIKWDDTTPEAKKAAKDKARKILNDIRGGADFAAKAREFGTDGTASRGGDLGWFVRGAMVKPFDNAVFEARKTGLLADLVETEFGYHIIDITAVKDNTYYGVATIEHALTASDETLNSIVRKADAFASDISSLEEYKAKAKKDSLVVYDANDLGTAERRINNLGESRQVVTWLFREAKVGAVSSVFDLNDNYIVAIMTGEIEKGFKPFEKVKEEITPVVTNQIKGKFIAEKLKGKTESLDDLAKLFGKDAVVQSVSDLKINAPSMSGPGFDPEIIGAMFSAESGKRTRAVIGENGVVVGDVQNKTTAPAIGDFSIFKSQLLQNLINRGGYYVTQTLKDGANIDDKRYKFF